MNLYLAGIGLAILTNSIEKAAQTVAKAAEGHPDSGLKPAGPHEIVPEDMVRKPQLRPCGP